jgi:hypothetical protein
VTIKSDFRLAILDRGRDGEVSTQRRRGAKPQRDLSRAVFGRRLVTSCRSAPETFGLGAFAASRLGVEIGGGTQLSAVKAVKAVADKKSHLQVLDGEWRKTRSNLVKVSQTNFFPSNLDRRVAVRAAKFAGLKSGKTWPEVNLAGELSEFKFSRCQQVPDNVTYCQVCSGIGGDIFSSCCGFTNKTCASYPSWNCSLSAGRNYVFCPSNLKIRIA